jgi:hypothetical protein
MVLPDPTYQQLFKAVARLLKAVALALKKVAQSTPTKKMRAALVGLKKPAARSKPGSTGMYVYVCIQSRNLFASPESLTRLQLNGHFTIVVFSLRFHFEVRRITANHSK